MKTAKFYLGLGILAFSLLLGSCKKDNNNSSAPTTQLSELFTQMKTAPQVFTVEAGTYDTIVGANGLVLKFNPESFLDGGNNIINNGAIKIELIEVLSHKDMVANRVQTITRDNKFLVSGGAYHIKAEQVSTQLPVSANYYGVDFPAPPNLASNTMALFLGYESAAAGGNTVRWEDDTSQTTDLSFVPDPNGGREKGVFSFDTCLKFGWINCDYFFQDPRPKTDITVQFPNTDYNAENTEVILAFPNINSVTMLYAFNAATRSFKLGYGGIFVPVGETISVLAISSIGSEYFFDIQSNVTVTDGIILSVNPSLATSAVIADAISNL